MNSIKKRGSYLVLLAVAAVLAIVTAVLGMTQKAMTLNNNFSLPLTISLIAGTALALIHLVADWDFLPLLASVCFSAGFGMIINEGLAVVVDKLNDISFQGGVFPLVAAYMAMSFVACVLSIVACFLKKKAN
jgi:hypothetical protein